MGQEFNTFLKTTQYERKRCAVFRYVEDLLDRFLKAPSFLLGSLEPQVPNFILQLQIMSSSGRVESH